MNLFEEAGRLQEQGSPFAVCTIIAAKGSTPRSVAKMIVKADGSILGTIGGGLAELYIIREAVNAIQANQSKVVEYTLNNDAADGIPMQCGGSISVFIEVVRAKPCVVMIGGGHVGMAVGKLAAFLGYRFVIIDDRVEYANTDRYPMASEVHSDPDMAKAVEDLSFDANSYVVIATKDADFKALRGVVNSDAPYIGMIGSKRKVALVFEQLKHEGIEEERFRRIYAPVGLDIGAETPEEIAVSILAEVMKIRNSRSGLSMRDS
jgi:xanthine dehydrogenase accessory factor